MGLGAAPAARRRAPPRPVGPSGRAAWRGAPSGRGAGGEPAAGSRAFAPERARQLPFGRAPPQVFALVVQLLRAPQRDRYLGETILEVQLERDEGEPLLRGRADELTDFVFVQQQLAGARGRGVVVAAGLIGRDGQTFEPHLATAHMRVGLRQARFAVAQRLDLRAREHQTGLPRVQEMVVVSRPRVACDRDSVHCASAKIETGSEAVKPRVDLRLYRPLILPFPRAEVVELVDALRSGRSGRKPVWVRVPPSASTPKRRGEWGVVPSDANRASGAQRHEPLPTPHVVVLIDLSISALPDPRSRSTRRSRPAGSAPWRNPRP